jgi:hypothetical protein
MPKLDRQTALLGAPFVVALVIMAVSCRLQGSWSERWGTFPELQLYAKQLDKIPMDVGEWKGEDAEKSTEMILKVAGAEGELVRVYKNATGQSVRVSIICARLRDVFYHTPDRCYPAAGFEMLGDPQLEVVEIGNNETADFFTTTFLKSEPTGTHSERGFWSWSGDGKWIAPKNPKLKFAGQKALYKMYVFAAVPTGGKKLAGDDFCFDFIRTFIPVLDVALAPAFSGDASALNEKPAEAKPAAPASPAQ